MALVNYATREINAKIVYYGPGLSGKTTNIHYVFNKVKPKNAEWTRSAKSVGPRSAIKSAPEYWVNGSLI